MTDAPNGIERHAFRKQGFEKSVQEPYYTITNTNNDGLSGDPEGVYQGKFRDETVTPRLKNPQEKTLQNSHSNSIGTSPCHQENSVKPHAQI